MEKTKKILRDQRGFTLIEIIAVLVILGILAAVAVPKYVDMQTEAHNAATQSAIASAASSLTLAFSKCIVNNTTPTAIAAAGTLTGCTVAAAPTSMGDFTVKYGGTWPTVTITIDTAGTNPAWMTAGIAGATGNSKSITLQ